MGYEFDLFTIGAGSGGVRASRMAAAKGARVAVAEAGPLGGTCVNAGCIPKKILVYAAEISQSLRDATGFGWSIAEERFDWKVLLANKDAEIARLNTIYERLLRGAGCELVHGRARLIDHHTVVVTDARGGERRITSERILVATGGQAVRPSEPGCARAWTSDDVFRLESLPARLLVVGGGYIALEMACIFHGLGTEVTIAHRGPHVLRGFDDDARAFVVEELRKKGIRILLNAHVACLAEGPAGSTVAELSHLEDLEVDAALFAIGRAPNTEGLGLDEVGVARNARGAIEIDAQFRTSVDNIYALGDVTDRLNLTPVAIAEAMSFVEQVFGSGARPIDYEKVPTAVFSSPPIATVGLSEAQARARGPVHVYTTEFRPLAHTISKNEGRSFMKIVADGASDRVLGIHLVGKDAPEIIQGFAVAVTCGATKAQLDATIGLHPTAAEELVTMRERRPG